MKPLRILVAEDDPIVAADLRESISEMGHRVAAVAHDGDEAARKAGEQQVELALVDIRIPGTMDGVDLALRLRADLDIPVIFVTAFADDVTLDRARAAKPWAYLIKPLDLRELEMTISLAVQNQERERMLRKALDTLDPDTRKLRSLEVHADERYRMIFRENPAPLCLISLDDHRILDVNVAFEDTFGWTRQELIGADDEALSLWVHAEDRARILDLVQSVRGVESFRTALRTKRGEGLEIDLSATPVRMEQRPAALLVCNDVTDRATVERELERMALYDPLTRLPNRNLFQDRLEHSLERARREGREVGVLFVDLDGFKAVNDTFGHAAGDEVLRAVAGRIAAAVRVEDTVARMGGDEFTVVLENDPSIQGAKLAARRIHDAFEAPFEVRGRRVPLSASIGISVRRAAETTVEGLVAASDEAMYDAKRRGGGLSRIQDEGGSRRSLQWEGLRRDLLRALEGDEMTLRFEPIVSLQTRRVEGAEALVRWSHPDGGLLAPAAFLPLAREEGLGVPVCAALFQKAAKHLRRWLDTTGREIFVTMDLAFHDLGNPEFEPVVEAALHGHGLPVGSLRVEVSAEDLLRHERRLVQARSAGLGIVLRRFGAGIIPLGSLRDTDLEVDQVKLDTGLISRYRESSADKTFLRGIIDLAHGLGIGVIADGLAEPSQLRELRSMGAEHGQGPAFGDAATAEDLISDPFSW